MYESLVENLRYWGACFPGYTLRTAVKKHTLTADDLRQAADALEELKENIASCEETIRNLIAATQKQHDTKVLEYMLKRYEEKLEELIGTEELDKLATEIARGAFRAEIEAMAPSGFRDFCLENFEKITGGES